MRLEKEEDEEEEKERSQTCDGQAKGNKVR